MDKIAAALGIKYPNGLLNDWGTPVWMDETSQERTTESSVVSAMCGDAAVKPQSQQREEVGVVRRAIKMLDCDWSLNLTKQLVFESR